MLAEARTSYHPDRGAAAWVEVLVDCPGVQGLFTYRLPSGFIVQPGDILSVPFGAQQVGAIAITCHHQPPADLEETQIRPVEAVIHPHFFPTHYWELLQRVAEYYCTPLMQVVRAALPPGLLARSQRRVRLVEERQKAKGKRQKGETDAEGGADGVDLQLGLNALSLTPTLPLHPLSPAAAQLLELLQSSPTGDYSWQYLQRQVTGAGRGLQELLRWGWVENYLEPPTPPKSKQRQAVSLVMAAGNLDLTTRQQEILTVLRRQGGEMWLADLLQECRTSSSTVKLLATKGCLEIQPREVLRQDSAGLGQADQAKPLTPDQATAVAAITHLDGFTQVLLHGVTGSGKTEVYLQAIAPLLQRGQSALVLVPEIGLTPQLTDRFRARFGDRVCVYHSALSDGERYDTWRQMLHGQPQVVIGTRSAVFAPLPNLGLIVLDEEHDSSFKQDQPTPCYHARTVAQWRAELDNCPLVLGSATPSLEIWKAIREAGREQKAAGESQRELEHQAVPPLTPHSPSLYLSLPERVESRPMPAIEVIDMRLELQRGNRSIFSRRLQETLQELQERRQQGILFIHRRGHSTFLSCRSCGYVVVCPNCDVSLSYHHVQENAVPLLRCHYCNYSHSVPTTCPACDSTYFRHFGSGTQRVAQELTRLFPDLRTLRYDSDTTRTKGSHRALLSRFAQGEADLLVGTQMLTKGIDLPQVTLVGVVAADGLLYMEDYRASERAFQTLTQVAGRSGRGEKIGRVILQTYSPEHAVVQAVQQQDYEGFAATELAHRAAAGYPPYRRMVLLRFSSPSPIAVQTAAERVGRALEPLRQQGAEILGPVPASIVRLARRYRWQLLLKLPEQGEVGLPPATELQALCPATVSLTVDIDPLQL